MDSRHKCVARHDSAILCASFKCEMSRSFKVPKVPKVPKVSKNLAAQLSKTTHVTSVWFYAQGSNIKQAVWFHAGFQSRDQLVIQGAKGAKRAKDFDIQ